jgi:glycosyltransferase involved in cell wall biosynthesis
MKIIYYSPHPHVNMAAPSGPGTHIREVVHALRAEGVEVITLIGGGEELRSSGGEIQFAKRSWKKWLPNWIWQTMKDWRLRAFDRKMGRQLEQMIKRHRPDAVYERMAYLMDGGSRVCSKQQVRHYLEINAPYPEEKMRFEGWSLWIGYARRLERLMVERAFAISTVSSAMRDYLVQRAPGEGTKIEVIPNAVDFAWFGLQDHRESMRQQMKIRAEVAVIGFVGSIFAYHGVDRMIEAAHKLANKSATAFQFLVVGDGEILANLKQLAVDLNVAEHIIFTGNVPHAEVYKYIQAMDVCVMPRSNWYGSPVKIFEYGALEKCIVGPLVIPVLDVMQQGVDGLLIEDQEGKLIEALEYLLTHPLERKKMAQHFRSKVESHHTWKHVAQKILNSLK